MIDPEGRIRCDQCHTVLIVQPSGAGAALCHRSHCKDEQGRPLATAYEVKPVVLPVRWDMYLLSNRY